MLEHVTTQADAKAFSLNDIPFAKGLGIVTQAIHDSNVEIGSATTIAAAIKTHTGKDQDRDLEALSVRERNACLAVLVRDACIASGWVAGWTALAEAAPDVGLHARVVEDVQLAAAVYARLRKGYRRTEPIDMDMAIGSRAIHDSLTQVGPKSLGGMAWKVSKEYADVLQRPEWRDPGYAKGFSPCVAYGWVAVQIKVIPARDSPDAMRLQLLNIVDYDLDYSEDNRRGFQNGFQMGAQHALSSGTKLQGAAFIGMISYDFQTFVRSIQQGWVDQNVGAYNLGPEDASPEEWTAVQVADCAALVPFAFESAKEYNISRTGMITGMMQLQCHDLLFDTGCGNRITTIQYAAAAGVAKYGIHAAFAIGFYEAIAKHLLNTLLTAGDDVTPPYGYSACMVAGPWNPFNTRYRAWERCVKYTRQLHRSSTPEAAAILAQTHADLVLRDCDLQRDAGKSWAIAMQSDASSLVLRTAITYHIPSIAPELLATPGVTPPDLCAHCEPAFTATMHAPTPEEVHAIADLPESVTHCRAAGLAAGLRRAVLWASDAEMCCDVCACRVGCWADAAAYTVLSSLMSSEPDNGRNTWCLQNYFVGTVTFWPVALPFLLSGFDLAARMSFEVGAMGERDIVDI